MWGAGESGPHRGGGATSRSVELFWLLPCAFSTCRVCSGRAVHGAVTKPLLRLGSLDPYGCTIRVPF